MASPDTTVRFRPIEPRDDAIAADIVRSVLQSLLADGLGQPETDVELGSLSTSYPGGQSQFFVVEGDDGAVAGCGGFGPLQGVAPADRIGELRKMYFLPGLRGRGVGRRFLAFLLQQMTDAGFGQAYLESSTTMAAACHLYRSSGFAELPRRMGATGRCGCDRAFLMTLPSAK